MFSNPSIALMSMLLLGFFGIVVIFLFLLRTIATQSMAVQKALHQQQTRLADMEKQLLEVSFMIRQFTEQTCGKMPASPTSSGGVTASAAASPYTAKSAYTGAAAAPQSRSEGLTPDVAHQKEGIMNMLAAAAKESMGKPLFSAGGVDGALSMSSNPSSGYEADNAAFEDELLSGLERKMPGGLALK